MDLELSHDCYDSDFRIRIIHYSLQTMTYSKIKTREKKSGKVIFRFSAISHIKTLNGLTMIFAGQEYTHITVRSKKI